MQDLPPLLLLAMAGLALLGVVEMLRAVAVLVRDETAIHDLLVQSARAKLDHMAGLDDDAGPGEFDVLD